MGFLREISPPGSKSKLEDTHACTTEYIHLSFSGHVRVKKLSVTECLNGFGYGFPSVEKLFAFLGRSVFGRAVVDL